MKMYFQGDPVGCPLREKKPFFRGARGRFCGTTGVNSDKWEKGAGMRG